MLSLGKSSFFFKWLEWRRDGKIWVSEGAYGRNIMEWKVWEQGNHDRWALEETDRFSMRVPNYELRLNCLVPGSCLWGSP